MQSVPYAARPVGWQNLVRLDALDAVLTRLDQLREVPQVEVDEHAADLLAIVSIEPREFDHLLSHALDGDNAGGAYTDLFARARLEVRVRLE